jgi:hypothetical protein
LPLYLQKTKKQNTQWQLITSSGPFPISSLLLQTTNKVAPSVYMFNPVLGVGLCDFNPMLVPILSVVLLVSHNKIVTKFFFFGSDKSQGLK